MASAAVAPYLALGRIFGLDLLPVAVQGSMAAADSLEVERHGFPATNYVVDCIEDHHKTLREQGSRSLVAAVVVAVATQAAAGTSFHLVFPPSCISLAYCLHEGARELTRNPFSRLKQLHREEELL
jgi:NhaP-type Na+/H+ or K+/H+ antiporter